ncbi:hypothetical protein NP493_262g00013 [Ridgeia piscesae]|uniref:Cytochrome P450 n=1 Tax=Ridgeia piscesae TaxID=27915 RepID=A0AAD9UCK5_RIDPI|nr:hypothetical protein NP493_262g00013 [Ridgeia piscesae]
MMSDFSISFPLTFNAQALLMVVATYLILLHIFRYVSGPANLPPGPVGYPVVGVLPLMRHMPHLTVQRWWQRYGDICSMYMGSRLVVILNSVDVMRECFVNQSDVFAGRPWNYFRKLTKNKGIVFTEGEVWREHRRFTMSCLRDFGMGKVCLEPKLHEETRCFLNELAKHSGEPFDITTYLPKTVSNVICSIIYGSRFDYNDDVFVANIDALEESVRKQTMLGIINFLPFLEVLPKILPTDKVLMRNVNMRDEYAQWQLDRHRESLDVENPRDFIDAYLTRMQNMLEQAKSSTFHESHLRRTIQDLFISGSETVTTTLKWSFLFMVLHRDVQQKVFDEIDRVVGSGRLPTMKDKTRMPYTQATIMECQRVGNIALFSVPRCTLADCVVNGYNIPKGTWVFVNRWGVHKAPQYWTRPNVFDPTRFLNKDNEVVWPDTFIPFGMGPRSCPGESLAKMELFIFFTAVLQAFRLELPDGAPTPSLEPSVGLNMSPQKYFVCATLR